VINSGTVVLPGDQASIPAQDSFRSDDASDLFKDLAAQDLAFDGEATALIIARAEALVAQLLAEDAVLLKEVLDEVALLAVDPGGEGDKEELEGWGEQDAHGGENRPVTCEI